MFVQILTSRPTFRDVILSLYKSLLQFIAIPIQTFVDKHGISNVRLLKGISSTQHFSLMISKRILLIFLPLYLSLSGLPSPSLTFTSMDSFYQVPCTILKVVLSKFFFSFFFILFILQQKSLRRFHLFAFWSA